MIELRWVERNIPVAALDGWKYRVLQYRAKDSYAGHGDEPDWGEWKDVPVEKEL